MSAAKHVLAGLLAAALVLVAAVGAAVAAPRSPPAGVALFHRAGVDYESAVFDPAREGPRDRLWIAHGFHADLIDDFRRANPSIYSAVYKEAIYSEAGTTRGGSDPGNPTGISYGNANANHRDWFLLDAGGRRITSTGYAAYTLMDIGNPDYQAAWAGNLITQAHRDGWDSVFADDLSLALYSTSAKPAKYPDAAAWQGAVISFLRGVYPKLHAAGVKLIANVASGITWPATRKELLRWVDGTMEEGWMRPEIDPRAPLATAAWAKQVAEAQDAEAAGKLFLAEMPAALSDTRAVRYGLASALMAADGMTSFDVSGRPRYRTEQWSPDFDTARRLGVPLDGQTILANGIRRRDFAAGAVLVNPTRRTQTADVGASAVTMPPTTGRILLTDAPLDFKRAYVDPLVAGAIAILASLVLIVGGDSP